MEGVDKMSRAEEITREVFGEDFDYVSLKMEPLIYKAMQQYADEQTKALQERVNNLEAELKNSEAAHDLTLDAHLKVTEHRNDLIEAIKEAITDIGIMGLDGNTRTKLRRVVKDRPVITTNPPQGN